MAYITAEYYRDVYQGEAPEDELPALIERASDIIDGMMFRTPDINALSERQAELLRKAVAAEVAYLDSTGGVAAVDSHMLSQATLGKFSYSISGSSGGKNYNGMKVCALSVSLLEQAGLLGRGLAP